MLNPPPQIENRSESHDLGPLPSATGLALVRCGFDRYAESHVFDNMSHSSYANYDPTCVSAVLTPFNQYLPFILVIEVGGNVDNNVLATKQVIVRLIFLQQLVHIQNKFCGRCHFPTSLWMKAGKGVQKWK